jgi:hypothetical protein
VHVPTGGGEAFAACRCRGEVAGEGGRTVRDEDDLAEDAACDPGFYEPGTRVDCFVLDWAIEKGFVEPKEGCDRGRFTSAHQEHYHYEDGLGG